MKMLKNLFQQIYLFWVLLIVLLVIWSWEEWKTLHIVKLALNHFKRASFDR
jgi:hypothetical protein